MNIVNRVTDADYVQWVEAFVKKVLAASCVKCKDVLIYDIEPSRRVFLDVDGIEYIVRTWDFAVVKKDENKIPCGERVSYTLFKDVGQSGMQEVRSGASIISWVNK